MSQHRLNEDECFLDDGASPYVEELKTILNDLVKSRSSGHIEYEGGSGDALYKDEDVAVQLLTMKKGEFFPIHKHNVKEWIINIRGGFDTEIGGVKTHIGERQHVVFEPGQAHGGVATEDLWCVCVTVPADEGYPDAAG